MKKGNWLVLLVVVSLALSATAAAEDFTDAEEVVVSATMLETPSDEVAQSVTVISAEEIEEKQQTTVAEVLREVPGLQIVQSGGLGGNTSAFIRGANSEHTLVLIDGVEVNDPSSPNRSFNFADLPTQNIERIEVLRGAQSVLYGSDAIGGVVNIITKSGSLGRGFSASSEAGSYDTFTERLEARQSSERGDVSLGFFRQDSSGISAAGDRYGNHEDDGYENTSASLRTGINAAENLDLNFVLRTQNAKTEIDNFGGVGGDDPNRLLDTQQVIARGEAEVALLDDQLTQLYGISYSDHQRTDDNDPDAFSDELLRSRYDGSLLSLDWRNTLDVIESQRFLLGMQWDEERASTNYHSESSMFGVTDTSLIGKDADNLGVFLEDQFDYQDVLSGTAGVRVDEHSRFGSETTWRIAPAVRLPGTGTKLRSSVGTGFKAPSLVQLYSDFGNPDLEAEESFSVDAGVDQSFLKDRLQVALTYFHNDIDNLVTFDPNTFTLQNTAQAEISGLELAGQAQVTEQALVGVTFTFMETEDEATGEELLRRPEFKSTFDLRYTFSSRLSGFVEAIVVGDRKDNDYSTYPTQVVTLDSYVLVNAGGSYRLQDGLELYARVENLFDEEYEEALGFGTLGAAGYGGLRLTL